MFLQEFKVGKGKLFWGDYESSIDRDLMKRNKIGFVFNLTDNMPNYFKDEIIYYRIPLSNKGTSHDFDIMQKHLSTILQIMHSLLSKGKNVLVHSLLSDQRSPYVINKYFLTYHKEDKLDEMKLIKPSIFDYGKRKIY